MLTRFVNPGNVFILLEKERGEWKKRNGKKISCGKGNTVALWNGDENLNFERFTFVRVPQMTSIAVCDNLVICDSWAQWLLLMVLKS